MNQRVTKLSSSRQLSSQTLPVTATPSRREFLGKFAGAVIAGAVHSETILSADVKHVAPFGDLIVVAGDATARGKAYGERFRREIQHFFETEIQRAFIGKPSSKDELLRYAAACGKVVERECPEIAAELAGMSSGCGLTYEESVLITLHEELYHRGVLPPVPHCTAVALSAPETRDGTTYCGQTWDWMPSVAGTSRVLRWERSKGPSLLAYGFPGLWVGAGLNSNGLALCWTSAALGQPKQPPRIGLPSYVLLTWLLYQESLDAARDVALRDKHAGWFTFVMADANGRLMNIEGSSESVEVVEQRGRLVRVGFGTHRMSNIPADGVVPLHPRCKKLDVALNPVRGDINVGTLKNTFSDPTHGICVGNSTIDLMIYDTTHKTAYVSRGREYGLNWREYRFQDDAPPRKATAES